MQQALYNLEAAQEAFTGPHYIPNLQLGYPVKTKKKEHRTKGKTEKKPEFRER